MWRGGRFDMAVRAPVLIVANSARYLACPARAAGRSPLVVDAFADAARAAMEQVTRRLSAALDLRGVVNGLDFVLERGQPLLLKLNDRPPAGSHVPAGAPLCGISSVGFGGQPVERLLQQRAAEVRRRLDATNEEAA